MKIIYLVDFLRTVNAGTERQLSHLLKALPESGYSVGVISMQDSPFLQNDAAGLFPGVHFHSLGAGGSDISRSFPSLVRLYRLIKSQKPDIVQTFFPASNSMGVIIARFAGIKAIISSRRDMGYHLTKKDIFLYRIANLFVSRVICNSDAARQRAIQLENIPGSKAVVIYNGIDVEGFNERDIRDKTSGEKVVGIVANLNRQVKRVDIFIEAAAIVNKRLPDVKFQVIGDGNLRQGLESLATSLGLGANISFMGRRGDVKELLKEMTLGVISSDSEGLSNAIMEYMCAGLPVIATRAGGNPELVQEGINGYLFDPGDSTKLAELIIKVLSDPIKALKMGNEGYNMIKNQFGMNRMIEETKGIYRELCHQI